MENESARIVSSAILGLDIETVVVNGKAYVIPPPTIHRIVGAANALTVLDAKDGGTLSDMISVMADIGAAARALSWFICDGEMLSDELSQGALGEVTDGLQKAFRMISAQNFMTLLALTRSVARLIARPK